MIDNLAAMTYKMADWYSPEPGHWVLCKVTSNVLGLATATTYDGEPVAGHARRLTGGCWLVKKQ